MSLAEHGVCQYKAMDNHQTMKWHSLAKVHAETDHLAWTRLQWGCFTHCVTPLLFKSVEFSPNVVIWSLCTQTGQQSFRNPVCNLPTSARTVRDDGFWALHPKPITLCYDCFQSNRHHLPQVFQEIEFLNLPRANPVCLQHREDDVTIPLCELDGLLTLGE